MMIGSLEENSETYPFIATYHHVYNLPLFPFSLFKTATWMIRSLQWTEIPH